MEAEDADMPRILRLARRGRRGGAATLRPSMRRPSVKRSWLLLLAAACSQSSSDQLSPLAQQGHTTYRSICTTCHNGVPSQDGAVGPAIAGSPRELIEAKVLRGEDPPGYTPKRPTQAMPRFEYLADQIDALAAYRTGANPWTPAHP